MELNLLYHLAALDACSGISCAGFCEAGICKCDSNDQCALPTSNLCTSTSCKCGTSEPCVPGTALSSCLNELGANPGSSETATCQASKIDLFIETFYLPWMDY